MKMTREELKSKILSEIKLPECSGDWYVMEKPVTAQTINAMLNAHSCVEIPYIGEDIYLDEPIIMGSNNHLRVAENQSIKQSPDSYMCLLRNENLQNGAYGVTDKTKRDRNISIEGGIWNIKRNCRCFTDKEKSVQGSLGAIILAGVEQVSLKNMRVFDMEEIGTDMEAASYGIQISDCYSFTVENIDLNNNHRDGVHINGPASHGHVKHLRSNKMGDDMVALNAWDWDTSAVTFGTIENIVIEDVESEGNELRILPGQKVYENEKVDCDIKNCILENISGLYTVKMYAQQNIDNLYSDKNDISGAVGRIENVYFKDIVFKEVKPVSIHGIPVKGFFEVCADCKNIRLDSVGIDNAFEESMKNDMYLMSVGPLSATWKCGSENPSDWGEVFDPDAICSADEIYLKDIKFKGEKIAEASKLVREIHMKINPDYPDTLPKGGTGYGNVGKVIAE